MKVYEIITEKILEKLASGTVPWQKPWRTGFPANFISKKEYRGINSFLLNTSDYKSKYWITSNQIDKSNGKLNDNAKFSIVTFYKMLTGEKVKANGEIAESNFPMLRYYKVYNMDDVTGIKIPLENENELKFLPIETCEKIVDFYDGKPTITHSGGQAFYRPLVDTITMPDKEKFKAPEEYYSTLFHEMTHSTGNEKRLNRLTLTDMCQFGSTNYSKEELVAEMGASFLCGIAQIDNNTIDNSASYISGWLKKLKSDPKLVISAGSQAQKAVDHITGAKMKTK